MSAVDGLHYSKIILEGVSAIVIKWISKVSMVDSPHPLFQLINQATLQLQHFDMHHIFRQANFLDDRLAKYGPHWNLIFPSDFARLIQYDALGCTYLCSM